MRSETLSTYAWALVARAVADRPPVAMQAALLRVASGAIFVGFSFSKFTHHAKEARSFDRYSLPSPSLFAYAIGTLELSLGVLLVIGLATRLVALPLVGDMVGAIATAGRVDGGAVNLGLAPSLLVVMLFLLWAGAGRWSLDARLRQRFLHPSTAPP